MRLLEVNAFTDQPFGGNPAAVCYLTETKPAAWLQAVARELNLSETAFVLPQGDRYQLRWFTPTVEIDLCGHATLATAHALWQHWGASGDLSFETRSGRLGARSTESWIWLDFPAQPVREIALPPALASSLKGVSPHWVGRSAVNYLIELETAAAVASFQPDFNAIATLDTQGLIVTAAGDAPYKFVSRYFAPAVGINEDPVTGSAHCSLAPYWQVGAEPVMAAQVSARGGVLKVNVTGDRVGIAGQAVSMWQGELLV